ncbi:nuclear transport factor 2 family protein, partial [Pseudomonas sp.]|uniref:nuclear transport factor 2 family protein n=1 Tax=Pseudomonas sp. TaxID=306 RepID=UPI00261A8988
ESSKHLVSDFLKAFSSGNLEAISAFFHEDFSWWVAGSLEGLSGTYDRRQMCELLSGITAVYKQGALPVTPISMIAESDRVAVEVQCYAELVNGRIYKNQLHMAIELSDGKIKRIREYMDTVHAYDTFLAP